MKVLYTELDGNFTKICIDSSGWILYREFFKVINEIWFATHDHFYLKDHTLLYTDRGWLQVKDLKAGDILLSKEEEEEDKPNEVIII